ncbi:hypothetical protein [Rivihabitans pingtungensis]|uniref:hypothetical protein n=1 Tax=Rivihabitans pingtungensis TaxID=1054498 RepID=UPI0023F4FE11|nr:hypothetical protein [Rivihabitans pingtungensis]
MTTPSSPSSRPQPISLDVDIELTELTPAEGLPTRSPANPASVDMQALLAREEAAFARIFRKGKPARVRSAAPAAPPLKPAPVSEPSAADLPPADTVTAAPVLPASEELDAFVGELLASAEHDRQIDAPPVLAQELAPADEAAPTLPASEELDAFVGELLASAEHDRQIDASPVLAQELAPADEAAPALPASEELDAFVGELLASAERDRQREMPPVLPVPEAPAAPASSAPLPEVADEADGLDFAFEEALLSQFASRESSAPVAEPPVVMDTAQLAEGDSEQIEAHLAALEARLTPPSVQDEPASQDRTSADLAQLADDLDSLLQAETVPPTLMTRPADDGVPAAEHDPLATPHEVSALDDALDFDLDAMLLDASPVEAAPQLDAVAEAEAPVLQPADLSAVTALDDSEAEALAALETLADELDPPVAENIDQALSLDLDAMLMAEALAPVLDAPLDDTADDTPPPAAALPDAEPVSPQAAVPPETDMLTLDLDAMLMGDAPAAALVEDTAEAADPVAEPVASDGALTLDLDAMLMGDAPAAPLVEDTAEAADPVAEPVASDDALTLDLDAMLLGETPAAPLAEKVIEAVEADWVAQDAGLPPSDAMLPAEPAEDAGDMLELDLDALLMAELPSAAQPEPSDEVLAVDAPVLEAVTEPLAEVSLDLEAMLMASADAVSVPDEVLAPAAAELDLDAMLMADEPRDPVTAGLSDAMPASELTLDLDAMLLDEPALVVDEAPLAEQDVAPLLEADSIESAPVLSLATDPDDDREPTPLLLDADARVPAPAAAEDMLELDLPLTPPPVLEALHDDTPAPAVTAPPPAPVAVPPAPDGDVLSMLAQSLEGNWLAIVQGSSMPFRTFRRGLDTLSQRLTGLSATGLPGLLDAVIELADSLPISGPSPWTADAVSRALELLSDTLISLPHPSTTQRAAVQMLSRELRAGPPAPMVPVVDDDMPAEPAVEPSVDSAVVDTPDTSPDTVPQATAIVEPAVLPDPAPEADHPAERMDAPVDLPAMDEGDENLAELPPAEMAWPAQVLPHEQAAADLAAGDVDLAEMLAELPALTDVLEDEPSPEALAAALAHAPDIEPEPETDAVADTPEQPVVDAEEGESLAGWLAERPLGEEDEARLASVISVPAADAEVLPEDDDWTQPPLEELARLAKEAPLATPEPDAEIIEPAAPAPDVVTHWPADEEAALLPGFDVLPELGSADEPAPATTALDDAAVAAEPDVVEAPPVEDTPASAEPADVPPAAEALSHSISLEDIPHLRQALGSGFPTVAQALAEPAMAPAFPNSIAVDDIPLLRAGTLEALLERIEPVEETPPPTAPSAEADAASADTPAEPAAPAPEVTPLGPAQLAAFFASLDAEPSEPRPDPAIDLAAFLVVAQGRVQRMVQECRAARTQGIGPGFVAAADELGHNASEAGVSAMASLAAALASALTRPLSPQAVLELATDTVAVLSVMVSQGQRQEPIEPAPDMVAALEALTAKPPVRKAL